MSLEIFNGFLALESSIKQLLVTAALHLSSLLSELFLSGVVSNELQVALAVEHKALLSVLLLFLLFNLPLVLEHCLFALNQLLLLVALHLASLLLPVENGHRIPNLLLLLTSLCHFSFELFLGVELPQLGIHLLL